MMQINIHLTYCFETCHRCHPRTLQMTLLLCALTAVSPNHPVQLAHHVAVPL